MHEEDLELGVHLTEGLSRRWSTSAPRGGGIHLRGNLKGLDSIEAYLLEILWCSVAGSELTVRAHERRLLGPLRHNNDVGDRTILGLILPLVL